MDILADYRYIYAYTGVCLIYLERIYVIYAQLNLVWPSTWHVLCKLQLLLEAVSDKWWNSTHSVDIYNVARCLSIKQCINIGLGIMYITYQGWACAESSRAKTFGAKNCLFDRS